MNRHDAETLVALLVGAYPRERFDAANVEVYRMMIEKLQSEEAARDAIMALIETAARIPSIAEIREEYLRYRGRYAPRELPEPEVSPERRADNLRMIRDLADRIGRTVESEEAEL